MPTPTWSTSISAARRARARHARRIGSVGSAAGKQVWVLVKAVSIRGHAFVDRREGRHLPAWMMLKPALREDCASVVAAQESDERRCGLRRQRLAERRDRISDRRVRGLGEQIDDANLRFDRRVCRVDDAERRLAARDIHQRDANVFRSRQSRFDGGPQLEIAERRLRVFAYRNGVRVARRKSTVRRRVPRATGAPRCELQSDLAVLRARSAPVDCPADRARVSTLISLRSCR